MGYSKLVGRKTKIIFEVSLNHVPLTFLSLFLRRCNKNNTLLM